MYTGGIENHPALVDRLAASRQLYGVGGAALRAVRDPLRLAEVLRAEGFCVPGCSLFAADVPTDGSWLVKPAASSGGCRIEPWVGAAAQGGEPGQTGDLPRCYFQQRIAGLPASAVYLAARDGAICWGISRQLLGLPWCGVARGANDRFRYCGSIGPLAVSPALGGRLDRLGSVVAEAFELTGLFGVDFILAGDEIWTIEVNPRYPASVEVLERAGGTSAVGWHVAACREFIGPERSPVRFDAARQRRDLADESRINGKAILHATADAIVGTRFVEWVEMQNGAAEWPVVADIPAAGASIRAGQPIVTVMAAGRDDPTVLACLEELGGAPIENWPSRRNMRTIPAPKCPENQRRAGQGAVFRPRNSVWGGWGRKKSFVRHRTDFPAPGAAC